MNIYNVVNHRLNGEKLRKLNEFATDLYGGVLGSSSVSNVFTYSGGRVSIKTDALISGELYVLCGGCLVTLTDADIPTSIESKIYYLQVLTDFSDDSIVSDSSTDVSIVSDTNTSSVTTYASTGQSIIIEGGFKVPLFMLDGSTFTSVVKIKDKSSTQDWLSQSAVADLWNDLYNVFVCQEGKTNEHPTGGNVANFRFSGNDIEHTFDGINFSDFIITAPGNRIQCGSSLYSQGPLVMDDLKIINSVSTLPIGMGGTGATTSAEAKQKLGIYYGNQDPAVYCTTAGISPKRGDLYFKILEN